MRDLKIICHEPDKVQRLVAQRTILAGDIGGTNSNFGLFAENDPTTLLMSVHTPSQQVTDYTQLIAEVVTYMRGTYRTKLSNMIVGIAGPVRPHARTAKPTHLRTTIDADAIAQATGVTTILCNDFELVVWGAAGLRPSQYMVIQKGKPVTEGTRVYVGAGTGLGHALGFWDRASQNYQPIPTEAGHTDFAPSTEIEWQLSQFVGKAISAQAPISWEDLLSGAGMGQIYSFLKSRTPYPATPISREIAEHRLQPDKITAYATQDMLCADTCALYQRIYARYIKNSILSGAAYGGLYIAGGIAARNPSLFTSETFTELLHTHNHHAELLKAVPVTLITDYNVSLYGGAVRLRQLISG